MGVLRSIVLAMIALSFTVMANHAVGEPLSKEALSEYVFAPFSIGGE